jgi:hypothetical protein
VNFLQDKRVWYGIAAVVVILILYWIFGGGGEAPAPAQPPAQ